MAEQLIRLPDGSTLRVPDGVSRDEVRAKIAAKFPDAEKDAPSSWSDTFAKAKQNLPSPLEYIKSQFTNPVEDVKNAGKVILGGVENALGFTPQQQIGNEQEVANQFGRHYANYASESGIQKNISQDPIGTLTDVLSLGTLPWRKLVNVATKPITPVETRPLNAQVTAALRNEGITAQTAGQRTGSDTLKYAEGEIGGARTRAAVDLQNEQFTRAAARRIGVDSPHLDEATMQNAYDRIGGDINRLGNSNTLRFDPALRHRVSQIEHEMTAVPTQDVPPMARDTINAIRRTPFGMVSGSVYNQWRSDLGYAARGASNGNVRRQLYRVQAALDNAMERGMNPADRGAFGEARRQYRNWLILEHSMSLAGQDAAAGVITPQHLRAGVKAITGKRGYVLGRHDFGNLSRAGEIGMSKMPQSGTAPRAYVRGALSVGGALAGGLLSGEPVLGPAIGAGMAAAAPYMAGRLLMSNPAQAYLGNSLIPRIPPAGPGATMGRLVPPWIGPYGQEQQ